MPGTGFPENPDPIEDPHAAERDAIADQLGHILRSRSEVESVAEREGWVSGAGGAAGDVARAEALERLRAHFIREEQNLTGSRPPNTTYIKGELKEDAVKPNARVEKWADVAMWEAPKHVDPQKPKVTVSVCTPDPLGVMAMVNAQYTGRNLTDPNDVTDKERREAWEAATVSKLSETPLEWIQWSINFENVSRGFTHQMVRTRMATYAQESQRFAVKTGERGILRASTKLPPSLAGTLEWQDFRARMEAEGVDPQLNTPKDQLWRNMWDSALDVVETAVANMVDSGMPAEDARGLLPTNILTRAHMRVDMKTLLNLAGMRLCTQAQFEWRAVFAELAEAIRAYGFISAAPDTQWQYNLIADSFRPICYMENRCVMKAKSDRFCSIQAQVDEFEAAGIKSDQWEQDHDGTPGHPAIRGIHPAQWLADPTAARKAPGQE